MSKKTSSAMRDIFYAVKQRCYNPNCRDYKNYGGRGIVVCDRWLESFDNFYEDMGLRPEGLTLERVENDGPYSPDNCIWANRTTQCNNQRSNRMLSYQGKTQTLAEWARLFAIAPGTLHARLFVLGYSLEDALTRPVDSGKALDGKPKGRPPRKFEKEEVLYFREAYSQGRSFGSIAQQFDTSHMTVSKAVRGHGVYGDI